MNEAVKCVPARKKCAATTREAMLFAARDRFLLDSYESVGLRDVARDAGVDVALVSRYFGSKEALFKEVLQGCGEPKFQVEVAAEDLPAYFVDLLTEQDGEQRREKMDRLMIMLRSASSPTAAKVIRESFQDDVLEPLARVIGGPESRTKATLAMAIVIGVSFLKTVLVAEPNCTQARADLKAELLRLLEGLFAETAGRPLVRSSPALSNGAG